MFLACTAARAFASSEHVIEQPYDRGQEYEEDQRYKGVPTGSLRPSVAAFCAIELRGVCRIRHASPLPLVVTGAGFRFQITMVLSSAMGQQRRVSGGPWEAPRKVAQRSLATSHLETQGRRMSHRMSGQKLASRP